MAYRDATNQYSAAQELTATAASTNIIDHGSDRNLGIGEPLVVVLHVDVALDRTTADETYAFKLQTDDNSSFSSATDVGASVSMTTYTAGTRYVISVPPDTSLERYTRLYYTLGGTTPTGTVTAYIIPLKMLQNDGVYPKGYTIS